MAPVEKKTPSCDPLMLESHKLLIRITQNSFVQLVSEKIITSWPIFDEKLVLYFGKVNRCEFLVI